MNDVLIKIKGIQQYPDSEPDVTTFTTMGSVEITENKLCLCYEESEMIGAKDVHSKIVVEGDTVILTRSGGMESQLTIEKGRRHSCLYNTPQGDFVIGVFGESLVTEVSEHQGKIDMIYTIDVFSGLVNKNILEIKFKEI